MSRYDELRNELRRHPRTWLVTGVAGFIGSNLLETLLELGQHVVGLDNFSSGYRRNLHEALGEERRGRGSFRLIEGDIRDLATCHSACTGVDYVLHQAAIGSVPRSLLDPLAANEVNVTGTLNVLVAARDAGVKRVVFASSSAVYGDCTTMPLREETVGAPLSPYAVNKFVDEKYAEVFSRNYQIETVALRYFNVFGPRQDPNGSYAAVIPQWINALINDETCQIHGDGETSRDFVAVADVVQANLLGALSDLGGSSHHVFNVGAGRRTSLNELHAMLSAAMITLDAGSTPRPSRHGEFRPGDIRHSQADIGRIVEVLGYRPAGRLDAALAETLFWYAGRLRCDLARSA